ncbi:DUF6807 family protein [Membranihabitans marinus]|uniref:DUF6807 family protein n=1 Tax=Membranihabitans marinus TaxID=1227546 RepID=UPI001F2816A4|nr:DUF6807 family protein [Membranihabitans marinus]
MKYIILIYLLILACNSPIQQKSSLSVTQDESNGHVIVKDLEDTVLIYNYHTIHEKDVIRLDGAVRENYNRVEGDTFVTTSIYAVPRSDYIHPLYGLQGEMLTRDWPDGGHPHHRAIFWAWPEVEWGKEKGDIYALQTVFARPTGNLEFSNGEDFVEIKAENLWKWEDTTDIVREIAKIKVYDKSEDLRWIDLVLTFHALKDSITIATRKTDSYGGLNLRMQTPDHQSIRHHSDTITNEVIRSWSDFSGHFLGAEKSSGLAVLQHGSNPEYPGTWVEYPDLAWVQPTFPTPGTRYALHQNQPLTLRYRLVIHNENNIQDKIFEEWWDEYNH